jgi:hypothetical protein
LKKSRNLTPAAKVAKTVKFKDAKLESVKIDGHKGYDISKDVAQAKANVTFGELLKENPYYKKQLRPLIRGRKREYKLPSSAAYSAKPEREDLGAADIEVQVSRCMVKDIPVDSGSKVNIMIADIARAIGFTKFEIIVKVLRMANQSKVVPIGRLLDVRVLVG